MLTKLRHQAAILALGAACLAPAAAFGQFQAPGLAPSDAPLGLTPPPGQRAAPRAQPLAPVSPAAQTKTVLAATAYFEEKKAIDGGLLWRVFSDQSDINGNFPLVAESEDSQPLFTLDPGGYVVHVSYGLASATQHVVLGSAASSTDLMVNAGALRLNGMVDDHEIAQDQLSFQILKNEGGIEHTVLEDAKAGQIIRLAAGSYQIASVYGNANARIQMDLQVEPGKLTDATVNHKAAHVKLKLTRPGSNEALADTSWSVLTPGGDPVTTTVGTVPSLVLAEGDYIAVAQHSGQNVQREFTVRTGETMEIALVAP
jgi:hypothetical protein